MGALDKTRKLLDATQTIERLSEHGVAFTGEYSLAMYMKHHYMAHIDITRHEYAAIRRYLIRNRRRLLKKEGLL